MAASSSQRKELQLRPDGGLASEYAARADYDTASAMIAKDKSPEALLLAAHIALRTAEPSKALDSLRRISRASVEQNHLRSVLESVANARLSETYQDIMFPANASESTKLLALYYRGSHQAKFGRWEDSKLCADLVAASGDPSLKSLGQLLQAYQEVHNRAYDRAISCFSAAYESFQKSVEKDEWIKTWIVHGYVSLVSETISVDDFPHAIDLVKSLKPSAWTRRGAADTLSYGSQILSMTGDSAGSYDLLLQARSLAVEDTPAFASIEIDLCAMMQEHSAENVATIHRENAKRILFSFDWAKASADDRVVLALFAIEAHKVDLAAASKALTLAFSRSGRHDRRDLSEQDERASILGAFAEALVQASRDTSHAVDAILECQSRWLKIGYRYRVVWSGLSLLRLGYEENVAVLNQILRAVPRSTLRSQVKALRSHLKSPILTLFPAERRVVEAICEGLTSRQIAERLNRSHNTIRNQTTSIFRRLGVNTRSALVAMMKDAGEL